MATKRRRERILLRVVRGRLEPADGLSVGKLRARNYHTGDVVLADLVKPRHPGQWRCAHRLGTLLQRSVEGFENLTAHDVIKRLQLDAGVACEEIDAVTPDGEVVRVFVPQSLSFGSMEQGEFEEVYRALCRHVAQTYWPELTDEEVDEMAQMFPRQEA